MTERQQDLQSQRLDWVGVEVHHCFLLACLSRQAFEWTA